MKLPALLPGFKRHSIGAVAITASMVMGLLLVGESAGASSIPAATGVSSATAAGDYAVPANALFVAPNGVDGAAGLVSSPLRTVASAVTKSTAGQTIVLRGGTYHESVTIPENKKVTIQPYPGEKVVFDGSRVVSQWAPSGATWVTDWNVKFDASPTFSRGAYDGSDPGWTFLSPSYPMASHPDQVWINGAYQKQVGSLAAVVPGTFFVDYPYSRMYVGSDPTGKEVRASDLIQAFLVISDGSTLRGFDVRRYAPSVPDFGAVSVRRPNVTLENMVVSESATVGVSVISTKATLRNVSVSGSGLLGVHANKADGLVLDHLQVTGNNSEHFNMSPVAGGVKITITRGVTITGGTYSRNFGDGIWFDASVYDMKVIGTDVQDNLGHGIEVEISAKFLIADNLVTGNGKVGILPRNSNDGRIWNNTVVGNMGNINVLQDSRTPANTSYGKDNRQPFPDPTMTWVISNIEIKNNVNASPAPTSNGALAMREETGKGAAVMGGVIDGNFYNRVNASSPKNQFGWAGGTPNAFASLSTYRAATGMDPNAYSIDGSNSLDSNYNLTASAAYAAAGVARPLPDDIAALISQPAGTAHLGVFTAALPPHPPVASFTSSAVGLTGSFAGAASSASDGATIASYSWDFGDASAVGSGATAAHKYAKAGSYPVKLTVTDSQGATNSISKSVAVTHTAPVASFTSSAVGLAGSFAGAASSASDGATIASYSWDFGDASAVGSGATAAHKYAKAGSYPVKLTVTDSQGATNSISKSVAVTHAGPVAAFTASAAGLVGSFGGAASSASDGASIASYSWDFGDGSAAGSGASATHQYAKAASYPVKLTVTDSQGATNSVSKTIVVSTRLLATDGFMRSVTNGWGTADQGGAWAVTGNAANFSVAGGYAKMNLATAGATTTASLGSTVQTDTDTHATFALDKAPTGGGVYFTTTARQLGNNFYGAKLVVSATGNVTGYLTRSVSGAQTTVATGVIAGLKLTANTPVRVRFQVSGTGTANLKFKAWSADQTEPTTWALSAADATAALQKAGASGFAGYLSATATTPVAISVNGLAIHAP